MAPASTAPEKTQDVVDAPVLEERDHARGCPATRIEQYTTTRPANPAKALPAREVTVTRCIECGGEYVEGD